jgi:hypothetical protein
VTARPACTFEQKSDDHQVRIWRYQYDKSENPMNRELHDDVTAGSTRHDTSRLQVEGADDDYVP